MKPCISQACTLSASFAEDLSAFSEGGCHAVEIWLTKLETHLEQHSIADTRKLLADLHIQPVAASFQGGLLQGAGEKRQATFEHFRRRLDLCQAFGIPTFVVTADFPQPIDPPELERGLESLGEAARWAQAFDVRLALEFHGRGQFCTSLDTAVAVVRACGEKNVGICLDLFHYYTGPSKFEDLGLLDGDSLFHVQVCDIAGVARELATDRDRIFPGEGDFRLDPMIQALRQIGYTGWVSLELLNPTLWQVRPRQLVELGMGSLSRLLQVS